MMKFAWMFCVLQLCRGLRYFVDSVSLFKCEINYFKKMVNYKNKILNAHSAES